MKQYTTYIYNDVTYQVEITRKSMRNIRYRLIDNTFKISAPYLASKESIYKGLVKFAPTLINRKKPVSRTEDYIYLYGYKYEWPTSGEIRFNDGQILKFSSHEDFEKKMKKIFLNYITSRVRYYENLMGLKPHNVKARNMTTRYGSNSRHTRSVSFSLKLYSYSYDIIDAIVVHELAHSVHFDHSPDFYRVVIKYCPNYYNLHRKLTKGVFL